MTSSPLLYVLAGIGALTAMRFAWRCFWRGAVRLSDWLNRRAINREVAAYEARRRTILDDALDAYPRATRNAPLRDLTPDEELRIAQQTVANLLGRSIDTHDGPTIGYEESRKLLSALIGSEEKP